MFHRQISVLWCLISISSTQAFAFDALLHERAGSLGHLKKTAVIDEDGRMTEEEYARAKAKSVEETRNRFGATGLLNCNGYRGSAQLTGDQMTISTSAHIFIEPRTCHPKNNNPRTCTFTVLTANGEQKAQVSSLVGWGFKCPTKPRGSQDWAVLKLKNPVVGVKAYRLPNRFDHIDVKEKIIAVNAFNRDFLRKTVTGEKKMVKSIEECESRFGYREPVKIMYFESTCDSSKGSSGGSILKANSKGDILVGITHGNDESAEERIRSENGDIVKKPYKEGEWASYHVAVAGEFLATLRRATGQTEDLSNE